MNKTIHSKDAIVGADKMISRLDTGMLLLDVLPNTYEQYNGRLERENFSSYCEFLKSGNGRSVLKMLNEEDV